MEEPIESEYFNWLCAKVLERNSKAYTKLMRKLHSTEFVAMVPADRHRVSDGIELRQDFFRETRTARDPQWEELPCSVLELLISFAQRASFQTDRPPKKWFWEMMANLQLDQFRQVSKADMHLINEILDRFISRSYDSHGFGGLFPMTTTEHDQREIEIWYQFCEYLEYNGLV